jgi:hypothetical protein
MSRKDSDQSADQTGSNQTQEGIAGSGGIRKGADLMASPVIVPEQQRIEMPVALAPTNSAKMVEQGPGTSTPTD